MSRAFFCFIWVLLLVSLCSGREIAARFVFHDASEREGYFVRLQADTVHAQFLSSEGDKQGIHLHKYEFRRIHLQEGDSLLDLELSDFEIADVPAAESAVSNPLPKGNSVLKVSSSPTDARVYIDGYLIAGTTPLVVPNLAAGHYTVAVRKFLRDVDWWGLADAELRPGDTTQIEIPVLKPRTLLKIQSKPSLAEVHIDRSPSKNRGPGHITDVSLYDIRPAPGRRLHFFKPGYHDTVVTVPVLAYMPNLVFVEMTPITGDLALLDAQKIFVRDRTKRAWGRRLFYTASLPLIAGGIFLFGAERDWATAADRARSYDDAAMSSSMTEQLLRENRQYNRDGDTKARWAGGMAAGALLLGAIGLVLHF